MPNLTIFLYFDNNHSLTKYNVFLTKYLTKIVGIHILIAVNSFTASGNFCHRSSADTLANNFDPDQARLKVGPDLDPICLTH